jgi:Domain of unknown function (DUF389)
MGLRVDHADLARMRDQLLFDGAEAGRKLSRFWVLLVLAAMIASAGIVADSTATVIGAMIVAPLMTPILGTILSVVTGDRANLARALALVVGGAACVVAIGWLFGLLVPVDVVAETNSQVDGRVHPKLIDLVAALATGAVGRSRWSAPTSRTPCRGLPSPSRWSRRWRSSGSPWRRARRASRWGRSCCS